MKLATVEALKAFVKQVKENVVEMAKKTVENNGYEVKPKKDNK